jgi:hypothetical protein
MKRVIIVLLIVSLLVCLTACGEPAAETPAGSASEASSPSQPQETSAPEEDVNVIPEAYTDLIQLCDTITTPGLYWHSEFPGMEYGREHLTVTSELQDEIHKILTEHEPLLQPDMLDDDNRDRTGEAIIFDIGEGDGGYPSGSQLVFAAVIPLGPDDPVAPNSTFLDVWMSDGGSDGNSYTYPAEVYDELLALLKANKAETHADFEGEYIRMELSQTADYPEWGDTLECGDILLHSSTDSFSPPEKWQIEAFDLTTGDSIYRFDYSAYGDRDRYMRIAALNNISDYDYAVFFENGYAFRNSKDAAQEVYFPLPDGVEPVIKDSQRGTSYDADDDSIAWVANDGIRLRTAKQDGVTEELILPNSELSAMLPRPDYPEYLVYMMPKFICGGTKVVATVYSETSYENFAAVVYDIQSGGISYPGAHTPQYVAEYPLMDRYVAIGNMRVSTLYDVESGEVTELPSGSIYYSYDYKTVVLLDYSSLDAHNAPAYVCDIADVADRSRPLLIPGQPEARVHLAEVTEHYAIFNIRDFDGDWIAAARYREQ